MHDLRRPEFPDVHHKRVYRRYSAVNLAVRKHRRVKRPVAERTPLNIATQGNEVWSIDFISDSLANGWRLKCMAAADDFSHACVGIAVDYGISDMYMTRRLDRAARFRDYPASVRTDYGPEFTSRSFPDCVFQCKPASRSETKPPQALVSRSRDATRLEVRLVERWETGRRPLPPLGWVHDNVSNAAGC